MKLTKRLPTKPGLYWCWREGMEEPVGRRVKRCGDGELWVKVEYGRVGASYFTHYAGPLSVPDLPEPDRIEFTGNLYRPADSEKKKMGPNALYLFPSERVPGSFTWRNVKVTLEKV